MIIAFGMGHHNYVMFTRPEHEGIDQFFLIWLVFEVLYTLNSCVSYTNKYWQNFLLRSRGGLAV